MPRNAEFWCGDCKEVCTTHVVDEGIGPYEFWGRKGNDVQMVLRSMCCDGEVFEDELLRVEAEVDE